MVNDRPSCTSYEEWLLDTRATMLRMVSENPSLAAKVIGVPPLCHLSTETLIEAKALIQAGDQAELIDFLISALTVEVIKEVFTGSSQAHMNLF